MANTKQAIKRHRQSVLRGDRNNYYKATARTIVKKARAALAEGDASAAGVAVNTATAYLDRIASRGAIPKQRASRLKSRLSSQLNALG